MKLINSYLWREHVTGTWHSSSTLLSVDSPNSAMIYHLLFRSTTSSVNTYTQGVIPYKNRIVIPPSLRQHVLTVLHSAHQGVTSMEAHAGSTVFWAGISPAIIALQETCNHCNCMAPSQPSAPPSPTVPQHTPSNVSVPASSTTKGSTILSS